MFITPNDVAKALNNANPSYKRGHEMNVDHPMVKGCKLGTVFSHRGEYRIYVGLNGRNWKYPVIAFDPSSNKFMKMTAPVFDAIRKAS